MTHVSPGDEDPSSLTGIIRDATARKQGEAAFGDGEMELRDLLITLGLGLSMARSLDGTIRYWSEGCERLYGWSGGRPNRTETYGSCIGRNVEGGLGDGWPVGW